MAKFIEVGRYYGPRVERHLVNTDHIIYVFESQVPAATGAAVKASHLKLTSGEGMLIEENMETLLKMLHS
jgi:hypothetical protein